MREKEERYGKNEWERELGENGGMKQRKTWKKKIENEGRIRKIKTE